MNDAPGTVVVCFAVPDESRLFTTFLAKRRSFLSAGPGWLPRVSGELGQKLVTIVHTGIGDSPTSREHLARVLAKTLPRPRVVVSAGYAGALTPDLAVGDLILGGNYSAPSLVEAASACLTADAPRIGALSTQFRAVEAASDKAALHRVSGALAVDMETAWIAEVCAAAGLPLLSLRVISDAADQDFPVPGRVLYDAVRQRPRYLALPAWLATHPGRIAPFVRFVRGLGPARRRLTEALRSVIARL